MADETTQPTIRGCQVGCLAVVVLAAAFGIWTLVSGGSDSDSDTGQDAAYACENFVKNRLKAPRTAEFSGQETTRSGSEWRVTGAVDAENSFGAPLRTPYVCTVRARGDEDETWDLVSLTGLDSPAP